MAVSASATELDTMPSWRLTPSLDNSREAMVASAGLALSSRITSSSLRPPTPPAWLIWSTAICAPISIGWPSAACAPVSELMKPILMGPEVWAMASPPISALEPMTLPAPIVLIASLRFTFMTVSFFFDSNSGARMHRLL